MLSVHAGSVVFDIGKDKHRRTIGFYKKRVSYRNQNECYYMKKVSDILARKHRDLISIAPDQSVLEALKIMSDNNIGSILVMQNGRYLGLLTERDYARKVILKGKSSTDTLVRDIMSTDLPPIDPESTMDECMQLMSVNNIRYLPVFEDLHLVGIISINDVIKAVIESQAETISHLQTYIHS